MLLGLALSVTGCSKNQPTGATGDDARDADGGVAFAAEPPDDDEYMPGGGGLVDGEDLAGPAGEEQGEPVEDADEGGGDPYQYDEGGDEGW